MWEQHDQFSPSVRDLIQEIVKLRWAAMRKEEQTDLYKQAAEEGALALDKHFADVVAEQEQFFERLQRPATVWAELRNWWRWRPSIYKVWWQHKKTAEYFAKKEAK